jgi:hypothetical protein
MNRIKRQNLSTQIRALLGMLTLACGLLSTSALHGQPAQATASA